MISNRVATLFSEILGVLGEFRRKINLFSGEILSQRAEIDVTI